jgi:hypothetical protein
MRPETIAMNQAVAARIDAALAARPAVKADQDLAALRSEFEARLAHARELSQDLSLAVEVSPGSPPIIGALRRMLHELVVFYVNRLATRLEASRRQELVALDTLARIVDLQQAEIDALRQGRE